MGIAIVDAARLMAENRARHEELEDRHTALVTRVAREEQSQAEQRRAVYDEVLVPFRCAFSRVKNVNLAELAELALPEGADLPVIELARVRLASLSAVGALTGGLTSGAGVGAAAYAAVGAFAAASTGTPIAALSGAAATNATLAFLGGGSLAAGGGGVALGTFVLGGVVAAPVFAVGAAYVSWKGRSARRTQREVAASLDSVEGDFDRAEQRLAAVLQRSRQVRGLLVQLREAAEPRSAWLEGLTSSNGDYATYTPDERAGVAAAVGLMTTVVGLMGAPLTDDAGLVSDFSGAAVADAQGRLAGLVGEGTP
ncbi:hypothetical protein [Pseudonocardia pini]|uniref:hypothetical protein n=1 Tax=Pseudonocardia pini TaxID=2758030 RepID=UPI0015F027BC|nr:hypothetical protein [Pseudonocardia pini]